MFSFFKRKKNTKEENKEPKRPPRKFNMGINTSGTQVTLQNDVFKTPPGSPVIKHINVTLNSNKNNDNKTVPSNTTTTNTASGISSGDLDDEGDSQASPPNNVNNALPSRPPRATSTIDMGNNISKPEDSITDGDWTTATSTASETTTTSTTTIPIKDEITMKTTTAPIRQHVSDKINYIMDTTNQIRTNEIKQLKVNDKTENSNLDIKETNAFLSGNLKPNKVNVETCTETKLTKLPELKHCYNSNTNNIEAKTQQLNISMNKNSDRDKITQSSSTTEGNGIKASKPTSNINTSLECKNTNKNETVITKDCNIINKINKNSDSSDQILIESNEQPIVFIDGQDELPNVSNQLNVNIDKEFQEDINTEVSLLVKETREVICLTEKDTKKRDTDENINANMILNLQSSEQCLKENKTAVNQMDELPRPQEEEEEPLLPTIITEVLDDVKEIATNSKTLGGNTMIICQQNISVNNEQCKEDCEPIITKKMLSIRTNPSSIETFSSSPPKVTDSETEDDNSTTREFLIKNNLEEKDIKIKKHVHWADSEEGRTLESFEHCSSSSDNDDDDDDDEVHNDNGEEIENNDENKQNDDTSSEEENDNEGESSSDDDNPIQKIKEPTFIYKRQDTWLDMIDDERSKISDASEQQPSIKANTREKEEDNDDDDDDDSGEEETSDEESSSTDGDENGDDEEEDGDDEDNDKDDDEENVRTKIDEKSDSNVRNVEIDSSSLIPVHELYDKIARLQQEIMIKASGFERQHAELEAAYVESESIKQKSKQLEDELQECRCRNTELTLRMCNAESKLLSEGDKEKLKEAEKKIAELECELAEVKEEKQKLEESIKRLERERDQEVQIVRQALDDSLSEQESMELRYKKEFEQLRSLNSNREVQMLDDFEWKLREVEKLGKKKLADTEKELTDKVRELTAKLNKAEEELTQVAHLKLCEIELKQLRATAHEHRKNLRTVTRQLEDLQVDEKILQEEVNRLRAAIDREKAQIVALQNSHKEEIIEKDRKTQFKLQTQKNQMNAEWEEKLKRECSRLKSDLEKVFREEKMVAIETEKRIRDHELTNHRQIWEKKLENIKLEVDNYKKKLEEKEEQHKLDLESAQTHSDRDVLDLRRKMDKLDMQYQEKIEKLQETHEQEIMAVKQECERKIHQCESSAQLHLGTTRTTLELVKQQMANECELRIEQLKRIHQEQLEDQWEKMQSEKESDLQQLEEEHRKALELLEKKLEEYKKQNYRSEVSTANTNISKLFNSFMKLFHQVVTPPLKKQPSKESSLVEQPKEEKQINNDLTNKEQMSSRQESMLGLEMPSNSQNRSPVEIELRQTVEKLTKQVYEDRLEIQSLREQLSERMYPRQQQQPQRPQQPQQQQHHRRSRKSKSGRN